jgi:ABC-type uncharacterized transport system substrate-binding protein
MARIRYNAWSLMLGIWLSAIAPVQAHPHVFIDYQISLVHQGKQIQGFQLSWRVDPMNTSLIMDAFDTNRNGRLEPTEAAQVADNMRESMAEFEFFTELHLNHRRLPIREARDIHTKLVQQHLVYRLFIPCAIPLQKRPQTLSFKAIDPTNYVAFMPMNRPFHVSNKGQLHYTIERQPKSMYEPLLLKVSLR